MEDQKLIQLMELATNVILATFPLLIILIGFLGYKLRKEIIKSKMLLILLLILPSVTTAQVSDFKKVEKFGLCWVQKTQTIQPGQSALLPSGAFVSETKTGQAIIKRVGGVIQVTPGGNESLCFVWLSLIKERETETFFDKTVTHETRKNIN